MAEAQRAWTGTTGGGSLGQWLLFKLLPKVPLGVTYGVMACVVPFYMIFSHSRCKAIYRYFRDRWHYAPLRALGATYRNHYLFGQVVMDKFRLMSGASNPFTFTYSGLESYNALEKLPGGFMMLGAHAGHFEVCGFSLKPHNKQLYSIVFAGERATLQQKRNPLLAAHGITPVPVQPDLSHLFVVKQALETGQMVGMMADRYAVGQKTLTCDFLGAPAHFPLGPFTLAVRQKVPVLAVFAMKEGPKTYHIYVRHLDPEPVTAAQLAAEYVRQLEEILTRYPHQWYNFYPFWKP